MQSNYEQAREVFNPSPTTPLMNLFFRGKLPAEASKELRIFAKKTWFEHVKRRPSLGGKNFSPEELKIINTPLDQLLEEFTKSL